MADIIGFESSMQKGRSIVALTTSDSKAMNFIGDGLSDSGKIQPFQGGLGLLRSDTVESSRIQPLFYVGKLPWCQWLRFHLHSHPLMSALLGIGAGLLVTFVVFGAMRAMAERRIRGEHG